MSDSLQPHGLQHARLPCPSPAPSVSSNYVHQISDTIQPSHPLLSPSPPASIFPCFRVFLNESVLCIGWPKFWSFSFSISLSNEYSGLISFRIVWLDLLTVQGGFEESSPTLQFKSINYLLLSFLYSPTLISYMITGKTIGLTIRILSAK